MSRIGPAAGLACLPAMLLGLLPLVLAGLAAFGVLQGDGSLAAFRALADEPGWFAGLVSCLVVGALVAAASLPLGAAAALGAWRLGGRGRPVAIGLGLALVLPRTMLAPGLRAAAARLGWDQDFAAWALAELTLACPLVGLAGLLSLRRMDPLLLVAAAAAGASPLARMRRVLLPLAWPGLRLGLVLGFLLPFGDVVTARLLAGPSHRPLPVLIVDGAASGDPAALAAAALLGVLALLLLLVAWPARLPGSMSGDGAS